MRLLLVCNRPAVSTTSTSARLASAAFTASKTTAAGSEPAAWRMTSTPMRVPHVSSCSIAAARKVSAAASSTCRPSPFREAASLAAVVVLPAPLTPSMSSTLGRASRLSGGLQRVHQEAPEQRPELIGARDGPEHDLLACAVREVGGDGGAEVGRDQELLELLVERVVDRAVGLEHGGETGGEVFLGALQPVTQALLQTRKQGHGCKCRSGRALLRRKDDAADDGSAGAERRQRPPVQLQR